jgi:hypothetical protein
MMAPFALALLGCSVGAGAGLDLPLFDVVYECEVEIPPEYSIADLEYCFDQGQGELEDQLGAEHGGAAQCWPTHRHAGPCLYRCPSATGCNALSGCWCPS